MAPQAQHDDSELPAWSLDREAALAATQSSPFPLADPRDWAWGGATGSGAEHELTTRTGSRRASSTACPRHAR